MAMDLLCDNPELRPFVLSNVTLTGTRIGTRAGIRDEESERNRVELVRAPQNQPMNQVRDGYTPYSTADTSLLPAPLLSSL